jgi:hypothetical protein
MSDMMGAHVRTKTHETVRSTYVIVMRDAFCSPSPETNLIRTSFEGERVDKERDTNETIALSQPFVPRPTFSGLCTVSSTRT